MRWSAIFLLQFCTALDRCHAHSQGKVNFPFASENFCLFFERFPETRPTFFLQLRRPMFEARMHMWGQMMPKRGKTVFPVRILHDALELLASVDELHSFIMVLCPYTGLDWQGCANILFTDDELRDDRGIITLLFKFILTSSLNCLY